MKACAVLLFLCASLFGGEIHPRWIETNAYAGEIKIDGRSYTNARIRRAGPDSVIVRHANGFFATAVTNLPMQVLTNLIYVPSSNVLAYASAHLRLDDEVKTKLLRGELSVADVEKMLKQDEADRIKAQKEEAERKRRWEEQERADQRRRDAEDAAYALLYPDIAKKVPDMIKRRQICIGMRKRDVEAAWGRPRRINETTTLRSESEQWVYDSDYVYFGTEGLVTAIQTHRGY